MDLGAGLRSALTLAVLGLLLVLMAVLGWSRLTAPLPESQETTGACEPWTVAAGERLDVGQVEVSILNAGTREGLAGAVMAGFVERGFRAGSSGNAPAGTEVAKVQIWAADKRDPAFAFARDRDRENGFPDDLRVFMTRPLPPLPADAWSAWPAPAKLNLFLRIVGRRHDGYHDLQTVFRLLDWGDEVRLRVRPDGDVRRVGDIPGVPPEQDITVRAARLLQAASGSVHGAEIAVDKRIPMGGGLGGGSSDAATVLVALNYLWDAGLDEDALAALGRQLGADVPVFVRGRTAWAEGVGERLTPVALPRRHYVVVDPREHVPTAALFQAPELTRNAPRATISSFVSGETAENVFEPVVRARHPRVDEAMGWLGGFGRAKLSGSGGCVFLETPSLARALSIAARCPAAFNVQVAAGADGSMLHRALVRHRGAARTRHTT